MQAIAAFRDSTSPRFVAAPAPPPPGPGEVLCRTLELGICGTDREILHSARPWMPERSDHLILGHECLARVEAVGPGVTEFSIGDLVVPQVRRGVRDEFFRGAASCIPPERVDMLPFGTFIERGIVFAHGFSAPLWLDEPRYLYNVRPELRPYAVLTEPLAVAEKGIHEALLLQRARLDADCWSDPPPRVLVTGPGSIGFAATLACRRRGWPVSLYGRAGVESGKARLARAFGAAYLSQEADLVPQDVEAGGFDLLLECTGSEEVLLSASRAMASCGVLVWLGSTRLPRPKPLAVAGMIRDGLLRNHLHVGSVNAAPRDFHAALTDLDALRRTHPRELAAVVTARVPPAEALPHYEQREKEGIKTVVEFN